MKQGWEIKKLGEVCEIQGGSTPKRTESLYWEGGTYPWFTIEDIREQGRIITDTKQKVTKVAWDKLRVFPKDTVLLCCTASIGEYAITHIPITSNQQFNGLMIKDKSYLSPMYLMHYCATLKEKLSTLSGKATIDFVSAEKVRQIPIPIPPREEQERIVEELDCLSGIIEKKKQQLRELDALAQSIFYSMFGDPITNEKGWEVKKLEDVCRIINGYAFPSSDFNDSHPIKAIKITNVGVNEFINDDSSLPIVYNNKNDYKVHTGDIVLALTRTIISTGLKRAFIPKEYNDALVNQRVAAIIVDSAITNKNYVYSFLGTEFVRKYVLSHATALMQPNLSIKDLRELPIMFPAYNLQQEFASKIEAIEKQKALIKQSITQTEELFNARMDYYFN